MDLFNVMIIILSSYIYSIVTIYKNVFTHEKVTILYVHTKDFSCCISRTFILTEQTNTSDTSEALMRGQGLSNLIYDYSFAYFLRFNTFFSISFVIPNHSHLYVTRQIIKSISNLCPK